MQPANGSASPGSEEFNKRQGYNGWIVWAAMMDNRYQCVVLKGNEDERDAELLCLEGDQLLFRETIRLNYEESFEDDQDRWMEVLEAFVDEQASK